MAEKVAVRVPPRAIPTINYLVALDSDVRAAITGALAEKPVPVTTKALKDRLRAALGDATDAKTARDVVGELFGLASVASAHDWPSRDVADGVARADGVEVEDEQREAFVTFLSDALDSLAVKTLGKATDLVAEHPRRLHLARVVTDLVPIFDAPEEEPLGAVVVHRLRLDCIAEGEEVVEVALSTSQLADMTKTLERAQQKAASLEAMLGRLEMTTFAEDD